MKLAKKESKSLQDRITDDSFGFFITVAVVIFQALHTQYVLKLVSSLTDVFGFNLTGWHSLGVSTVIAAGILYFTLRDNYYAAIGFMAFESYMNICYYSIYIASTPEDDNYLFWIAIPAAFSMPALLGLFAHQLMKSKKKREADQKEEQKVSRKAPDQLISDSIAKIAALEESINQISQKVNGEIILVNTDTGVEVKAMLK